MSAQFGRWRFDGEGPETADLAFVEPFLSPYGPQGTFRYSTGEVSIVYCSLQPTKESCHEDQPRITRSSAVITWDGRLDNRAELIPHLRETISNDSSDDEIVAAAYERWKASCLSRLLGDWAVSIWNPNDKSLLLARDPVGTRPLYYSLEPHSVSWSTVLEPLVVLRGKPLELDEEYIAGCFSFFPAAHLTPYSGIHAVRPSTVVEVRNGQKTSLTYWDFDPEKRVRFSNDHDYEEQFRILFRNSVQRRLRSHHPVVAELSGGMDSSSIVCMADTLIHSGSAESPRLDTVSYYADSEPNWDERPYFSQVEEQRGQAGLHIDVSPEQSAPAELKSDRLRISPSSESEPSPAQKQLNEAIATRGYRVLLSGFGGDEVLGGVPDPTSELADLLAQAKFKSLARRLKLWALEKRKPWLHLLLQTVSRFLPVTLAGVPENFRPPRWLDPSFVRRHHSALTGYENRLRLFSELPTFQENLATIDALRRQLSSITPPCHPAYERRYPYLDRELLEFLFAIPREQLLRPGERRSLMRRALTGLVPAKVLGRKRKAFASRIPLLKIAQMGTSIHSTGGPMLLESLGIVTPRAFYEEVERARAGREVSPIPLLRAIGIEFWLKNLVQRGFLRLECGRGPKRKIFPFKPSVLFKQQNLSAESTSNQERR